jgi:ankyrin repeat protein
VNESASPQQKEKDIDEFFAALYLTDPNADRKRLANSKGDRVDGTCRWIESNILYTDWNDSISQLLWLSGGPGTGKTMMSMYVVESLMQSIGKSTDKVLLQYFCDDKDGKRNTATAILRGLIWQLLNRRSQLIEHILPEFAKRKASLFDQSNFEQLWTCFEKMLDDPVSGLTHCVLDGLDECEETSLGVLLRKVARYVADHRGSPSSHQFKMIICSREYPECIPAALKDFPTINLNEDSQTEVVDDIRLFIDVKLEKLSAGKPPTRTPWPLTLRQHVRDVFLDRAQGTFLWVGLVTKELERKLPTEVEEALKGCPPGLDQLYARLLLREDKSRRPIVAKILRWVTMTVRPLTLSELSAAINLELESDHFTPIEAARDYVLNCGFLKLEQATGHERSFSIATEISSAREQHLHRTASTTTDIESAREQHLHRTASTTTDIESARDQYVYLIHQSAKDYLLRSGPDPDPELELFRVTEYSATQEIATRCFHYLQDDTLCHMPFKGHFLEDTARLKTFPLLSYAVSHWHTHGKHLESTENIFDMSHTFYQPESKVRKLWLESLKSIGLRTPGIAEFRKEYELETGGPVLHMAAYFGLLPVIQNILHTKSKVLFWEEWRQVSKKDEQGLTALARAAQRGHVAVVQLLLEKGADIDASGGVAKRTPLMLATISGHEEVARLLIERGADLKAKDSTEAIALTFAAERGSTSTVNMLLHREADSHARDILKARALICAARGGQEALVRSFLLESEAVHMRDARGRTALMCAAMGGHETIVELLLNAKADVKARAANGWSALIYTFASNAHNRSRAGILRMLLEHGADKEEKAEVELINTRSTVKDVPILHFAVRNDYGRTESIDILLKIGADIEARDSLGNTALILAASSQNIAVVDLLLKSGADIDAKASNGRTALMGAAMNKESDIADFLLTKGPDKDAEDNEGQSALMWALMRSPPLVSTVRTLVNRGVTANPIHLSRVLKQMRRQSGKRAPYYYGEISREILLSLIELCTPLLADRLHRDKLKAENSSRAGQGLPGSPPLSPSQEQVNASPTQRRTSSFFKNLRNRMKPTADKSAKEASSHFKCDNCDEKNLSEYYHCSICNSGDFDLCQACIDSGVTCVGKDHQMSKRFWQSPARPVSAIADLVSVSTTAVSVIAAAAPESAAALVSKPVSESLSTLTVDDKSSNDEYDEDEDDALAEQQAPNKSDEVLEQEAAGKMLEQKPVEKNSEVLEQKPADQDDELLEQKAAKIEAAASKGPGQRAS